MHGFLILLALCSLTATGLMSLDNQIAGAWCDGQGPYVPRPGYVPNNQYPLHLTLNYNKGAFLVFSDDRTYEIAPDDRLYSAYWITPFPPEFSDSGDSDYPILITNPYSDRSVRAKEVDTREILREESQTSSPDSDLDAINPTPLTTPPPPQDSNNK